jgi:hypothetical protein
VEKHRVARELSVIGDEFPISDLSWQQKHARRVSMLDAARFGHAGHLSIPYTIIRGTSSLCFNEAFDKQTFDVVSRSERQFVVCRVEQAASDTVWGN